jgi:hypothetical protein
MPGVRLPILTIFAVILGLFPAASRVTARPAAQDQGLAVITSPLDGAGAAGLLPISGTATHPEFSHYELAFAYSPNPTDTWFPIAPRGTAPVVNEMLGRWDTSQISDGVYTLRLRVFYGDGAFLEAFVSNLRVQNATPTPPADPGGEPAGPSPTPPVPPTATQPQIVLPPTSTPRATTVAVDQGGDDGPNVPPAGGGGPSLGGVVGGAFAAGVRLTLISFLLLAAYVSLKAALRARPRR